MISCRSLQIRCGPKKLNRMPCNRWFFLISVFYWWAEATCSWLIDGVSCFLKYWLSGSHWSPSMPITPLWWAPPWRTDKQCLAVWMHSGVPYSYFNETEIKKNDPQGLGARVASMHGSNPAPSVSKNGQPWNHSLKPDCLYGKCSGVYCCSHPPTHIHTHPHMGSAVEFSLSVHTGRPFISISYKKI